MPAKTYLSVFSTGQWRHNWVLFLSPSEANADSVVFNAKVFHPFGHHFREHVLSFLKRLFFFFFLVNSSEFIMCFFGFFFCSAFSLCGENCSFFVCVCPQSTPLWMTPGAKFRKMVSANNFTLRQISMSLVIFYIFVSFFDLTGKICIAFFECLVFFFVFFASFLATIFALQIQRKCVFLCVFVF